MSARPASGSSRSTAPATTTTTNRSSSPACPSAPAKTPSTPPAASTSTTPPPGSNPRRTYGGDHLAATLRVMTIRFIARAAGVDEEPELDCLTAGVAEDENGSGMVLLFMCGLSEPDEQDIALEQDTHCLVTAN